MCKPKLALLLGCAAVAFCLFMPPACAADETPAAAPTTTLSTPVIVPDENYRIVEEDVLRMDVWGEEQLSNMQMQVTPDGKINVPFVGSIQAAGLTQGELTAEIARKFEEAQILIEPRVQITIMRLHEPVARVLGEVQKPGAVIFKDGDTIYDAIAQAGSYTSNAMLEKATLTHKGSDTPIPIDLRKMFAGDLSQNYALQNGDTIYIPPEDYQNKIYVLGHVLKPGLYPLKDRTTVLSAISLAGGPSERARLTGTVVVRGDPAKPERVACDLTKLFDKGDLSQDVTLKAGDVVIVPETKKPNWGVIGSILGSIVNISYLRRYGIF